MISIEVKDMTCGHCESSIRRAVAAVDKDAIVNIDLAAHRLDIDSKAADPHTLIEAVRAAGYTPGPIRDPVAANTSTKATRACCCR